MKNKTIVKRPRGRPLIYSPNKPQELLRLMASGYKDCQIYAEWKISKDCFYRWIHEYPEFKDAYAQGLPLAEKAWEEIGKKGMMGEIKGWSFNTWIAFMNRKFGWAKQNANGDMGGTTNININSINILNQKSNSELVDYIREKMKDLPEIVDGEIIVETKELDGSSE